MSQKHQIPRIENLLKLGVISTACFVLIGCASFQPNVLSQGEMKSQTRADTEAIRQNVEPLTGPLTMDQAIARALKYNLERRARMMEEALVMGQLDVSKFDMLPKIMAQAGYLSRDVSRFTIRRFCMCPR